MSDSLEIAGKEYISAKNIAKRAKYSSDYVSRLAREKKVTAKKIGNQWFVSKSSLDSFLEKKSESKKTRSKELQIERKKEFFSVGQSVSAGVRVAVLQTFLILVLGVGVGLGGYVNIGSTPTQSASIQEVSFESVESVLENIAISFYRFISPLPTDDIVRLVIKDDFQIGEEKLVTLEKEPATLRTYVEGSTVVIDMGDSKSTSEKGIKKFIKDSFSDTVYIELKDEDSGIIIPRFRNGDGEARNFLIISDKDKKS